ncbi:hypothetical protein UFOVP154_55 [uncultured Caudovirales phage]|uniref:Uncharacterized protein n=1 Tax=uncultured Caudovirales phage TaxID=2100421 RepID=A0A6J7WC60_9CAUD|nr:hypothetical protein UFOVP8_40 [uncultured Caudovirales phage]CAB5170895.1 hypothetical protein UFOVP154_55 [uncultured Caudovirales phage]
MSAALVQTVLATGTNSTSSVGMSVTVSAGNALIVFVGGGSGQSVSGVSGGSNSYGAQTSTTNTAHAYKVSSFVAVGIAGGTYTVTGTFSGATNYPWIMCVEVSGADTAGPYGSVYSPSPSSTANDGIETTSSTNTRKGLMFGLIFGADSSTAGTSFVVDTFGTDMGLPGTGYVEDWATECRYLSSTGSVIPATWKNTNSANNIAAIMQMLYDTVAAASASPNYYQRLLRNTNV